MIYQFSGSCNESPDFNLNVGVDASHTFWDLHHHLQSALGFQPVQLASFIIPGLHGQRKIEISQFFARKISNRILSMHNTLVGDIMQLHGRIVSYVFDLVNDRYINLKLTGTYMEKNLREPSVTLNSGQVPVQTLDDVVTDELFGMPEMKGNDPNFGILNDYYEIFGEMEEYVL